MNLPVPFRGILRYVILSLLLLVLAGIILSNYSAGISLAKGAIFFAITLGLILATNRYGSGVILTVMIVLWCSWCIIAIVNLPPPPIQGTAPPCGDGETTQLREMTGYEARVEPVDFEAGSFRVSEQIVYTEWESVCNGFGEWEYVTALREGVKLDLGNRTIQSRESGLFLHEVTISTDPVADYGCCPDASKAVIMDLPYQSFYDARYASDLEVDEYLGKETVSWNTSELRADLHFLYIPPPYHNVRILLTPFLDMSKYDNRVLGVLGFAMSSIILPIIKPKAIEGIRERIKKMFPRKEGEEDTPPERPKKRRTNRNL